MDLSYSMRLQYVKKNSQKHQKNIGKKREKNHNILEKLIERKSKQIRKIVENKEDNRKKNEKKRKKKTNSAEKEKKEQNYIIQEKEEKSSDRDVRASLLCAWLIVRRCALVDVQRQHASYRSLVCFLVI